MTIKSQLIFLFCLILNAISCNYQTSKEHKKDKNLFLKTGWYYISDKPNNYERTLERSDKSYFINPQPILLKNNFLKTELYESKFEDRTLLELAFQFDAEGTKKWAISTKKSIQKDVALIIKNGLLCVPKVISQIKNGKASFNRDQDYTKKELEAFNGSIRKVGGE